MVQGLIAVNEEARREGMAWDMQLTELEDVKDQRSDSDFQLLLIALGQMIRAFTQYMGSASVCTVDMLVTHISTNLCSIQSNQSRYI